MPTPGLSQSALDIITSAMRLLNAAASGEGIEPAEASDGLVTLNQMLDAWQIEQLMIFTEDILDFNYVPGQQDYTLGDSGDFDTPRPARLTRASTILNSASSDPLELPMKYTTSDADWQEIMVKAVSTTYPWLLYDDGAMPLRNLKVWPIPSGADGIRLYSWQPLTQFPDLTMVLTFPPGYIKAIRFNLAVDLAPEYGGFRDPSTPTIAIQSLARIKSSNVEVEKLTCDDVCSSGEVGTAPWSSTIPPIY